MADHGEWTTHDPLLTVITVVKDDIEGFSQTMTSLQDQDLNGVELIVIDSSADSAVVAELVANIPGGRYLFEDPAGIYAAMNSGLRAAQGDYVYFLNAGDWFADGEVIRRIREELTAKAPVWLFGPVTILAADGTRVTTPTWDYERERARFFAHGLFPPHQGTVVRREALLDTGGFDTSFTISADYAAALTLSVVAEPVQVTFPLAVFTQGGVSSSRWQESFRQFHRARQQILKPRGSDAIREQWETRWHFAKVWLYRTLRG